MDGSYVDTGICTYPLTYNVMCAHYLWSVLLCKVSLLLYLVYIVYTLYIVCGITVENVYCTTEVCICFIYYINAKCVYVHTSHISFPVASVSPAQLRRRRQEGPGLLRTLSHFIELSRLWQHPTQNRSCHQTPAVKIVVFSCFIQNTKRTHNVFQSTYV